MKIAFSIPEAAKAIGISRSRLWEHIKKGRGPAVTRIGKRTLITSIDLERWLDENRQESKWKKKKRLA